MVFFLVDQSRINLKSIQNEWGRNFNFCFKLSSSTSVVEPFERVTAAHIDLSRSPTLNFVVKHTACWQAAKAKKLPILLVTSNSFKMLFLSFEPCHSVNRLLWLMINIEFHWRIGRPSSLAINCLCTLSVCSRLVMLLAIFRRYHFCDPYWKSSIVLLLSVYSLCVCSCPLNNLFCLSPSLNCHLRTKRGHPTN